MLRVRKSDGWLQDGIANIHSTHVMSSASPQPIYLKPQLFNQLPDSASHRRLQFFLFRWIPRAGSRSRSRVEQAKSRQPLVPSHEHWTTCGQRPTLLTCCPGPSLFGAPDHRLTDMSQMAATGPIDPRLQYAPPAPQQYPPSVDALRRVSQQPHATNIPHGHADLNANPPRQPYYIPHQPHGPQAPPPHTHEPLDPALEEAESPLHDSDVHPSPDDGRLVATKPSRSVRGTAQLDAVFAATG